MHFVTFENGPVDDNNCDCSHEQEIYRYRYYVFKRSNAIRLEIGVKGGGAHKSISTPSVGGWGGDFCGKRTEGVLSRSNRRADRPLPDCNLRHDDRPTTCFVSQTTTFLVHANANRSWSCDTVNVERPANHKNVFAPIPRRPRRIILKNNRPNRQRCLFES